MKSAGRPLNMSNKIGVKDKATRFGIKQGERVVLSKKVDALEKRIFGKSVRLKNEYFVGLQPKIDMSGGSW